MNRPDICCKDWWNAVAADGPTTARARFVSTGTQAEGKAIYPYYRGPGTDSVRHGGTTVCDSKPMRLDRLDAAVWSDVCTVLQNFSDLQTEFERRLHGTPKSDVQSDDNQPFNCREARAYDQSCQIATINGRVTGRGLVVFGGLAKAIRRESIVAIAHWWGVTPQTVTAWRRHDRLF